MAKKSLYFDGTLLSCIAKMQDLVKGKKTGVISPKHLLERHCYYLVLDENTD